MIDENRDGVNDRVSSDARFSNLTGQPYQRAVFEYDLSAYHGTTIYSATLSGRAHHGTNTTAHHVQPYVYAGDGALNTADPTSAGRNAGGFYLGYIAGTADFSLDVREHVQDLLNARASHAATIYSVFGNTYASFAGDDLPGMTIIRSSEHVPTVDPSPAGLPSHAFYVAGEVGDSILSGDTRLFTPPDGTLTARRWSDGIWVRFQGAEASWDANFAAPGGAQLTVGSYEGATTWPFNDQTVPGLSVSGENRGTNTLTGRFEIYDIAFDGSGELLRLAASFEQHGEGSTGALYGQIRFNSTVPEPGVLTLATLAGGAMLARRRR